jgi:hypothetical protein
MSISRSSDHRYQNPVSIGEPEKVTSWPFKEPEKKSAWDLQDERTEAAIAYGARFLVDTELEAAKKRTAEIRANMSPPGALGLPELLEAARLKWGIPDRAFATQAIFDRIHIFPIDFEGQKGDEQKETYGNSSIIRPETNKQRDLQNGHRGILISMGLTAADHCVSHGIELGHIVCTIRNAPHAQECMRLSDGRPMHYLIMRDGDLTGSETQREELLSGKTRIIDEGGDYSYCFNIEGRKKKVALVQDNW